MITISRYVFAVFAILYTVESFWILMLKNPDQKRAVYIRQMIDISFIHLFAFGVLYLRTEKLFYLVFGGVTYLLIFLFQVLFRTIYRSRNKLLMNHICFFVSNGFIMISRISQTKAARQLLFVAAAILIIAIVPIFIKKVGFIRKLGILYAASGLLALGMVLILGATTNGAKISYSIFGFTFQPSEFVKILFVLFLAAFLYRNTSVRRVFVTSCIAAAYVLTLVASRDLGSAVIFVIVYVCVLYIATKKVIYFVGSTILFMIAAVVAYYLFSHVQVRVDIWLNPWSDIDGKGYQITQALFAIGTGGLFGTGVGAGRPTTIPFVEADMIFAAFGEEFGLIYAICLILVCMSCFYQFMKISVTLKDNFYRLCASGFAVMYLFQVLLTIGGSSKYIPLTGVTLPFVSYGGSSVLTTGVIFAIIQGLYLVTTQERLDEERMQGELSAAELQDDFQDEDADIDEDYDEYEDGFEDRIVEQTEKEMNEEDLAEEEITQADLETDTSQLPVRNNRREILTILCLFTVVFLGLIAYLTVYMARDAKTVIMNDYNTARIDKIAQNNIRGMIYTRDLEVVAQTRETDANETDTDKTDTDETEYERYYPYAEVFAHAVGYVAGKKSGIEAGENYYLSTSGETIRQEIDNELDGVSNRANNIITTLDLDLQQAAYEALGSNDGAVIVMKADTGEILAMVSKPSFDPNDIEQILDTSESDASYLLNRATQGLYPPGSTFKIVTALEYIREHPTDYLEFAYDCTSAFEADEYTIHCHKNKSHGLVDLKEAFAESCNSSFAQLAISLDREQYINTINGLLFNSELPAPFGVNKSVVQLTQETNDATLMQIAIGQSTTVVTPMHMAMLTQAIANQGVLLEPYYVQAVTNAEGKTIHTYGINSYGALLTEQEAEIMTTFMRETVATGTAISISSRYQAAGKTGSAEYSSTSTKSHAWFTGFAPYDDPQIVVTVIVEKAGTGSEYAVPIASKLFKVYFDKYMEE